MHRYLFSWAMLAVPAAALAIPPQAPRPPQAPAFNVWVVGEVIVEQKIVKPKPKAKRPSVKDSHDRFEQQSDPFAGSNKIAKAPQAPKKMKSIGEPKKRTVRRYITEPVHYYQPAPMMFGGYGGGFGGGGFGGGGGSCGPGG